MISNFITRKIIMFGPPGVGKGSVSQILSKKWNLTYISTGDMLREQIDAGTPLGDQIKDVINKGFLVNDTIINEIVEFNLNRERQYLLDGYPRTLSQANFILMHDAIAPSVIIDLQAPNELLVQRMLKRARSGETAEVITQRLQVYEVETQPVLGFFTVRNELKIMHIDGSGTIEETVQKIEASFAA